MNDDNKHACPYRGCPRRVSRQYLACRAHWMKVPAALRAEVYAAYDGRADRDYLTVRAEAVEAMNAGNPIAAMRCRVCGCTDDDCSGCIERTGRPCSWVERDLCSACVGLG